MAKDKVNNKDKEQDVADQIDDILGEKEYQGLHYGSRSGNEIIQPDIISTGSFFFDYVIGGGFRSASWSRFWADPESGKTSQGLVWGRNWQNYWKANGKIGKVIVYNAEGRVTSDLINRAGINTNRDEFRLIDSNNADFIYSFTERLILDNKLDIHYFFIIDSTDACVRSHDREKSIGEAEKIGGGATVVSAAGKRLSLLFSLNKHHLYLTSQVRDKLTPGGMGGKSPSGGNAPKFYSSLTGKIEKHWSEHSILENPSDKKSKEIGRIVNVKLEKTYNESSGTIVQFPVKYGKIGGVWREYEALMICRAWDFIEQKGAHYSFAESFAQELSDKKVQFEPKFHGEKNMRIHFDGNPELVDFIFDKMKTIVR